VGVVHPRSTADLAVPGTAGDNALGERSGQLLRVVFQVPAIAEQDEGNPGFAQERLGGLVLTGQQHAGGVRVGDAGVGQQFHAFGPGCLDDGTVLFDALAHFAAGDQQHPRCPLEYGGDGRGVGVVHGLDVDTARSVAGQLFNGTAGRHNPAGGHAALQEGFDDVLAELSGGACNNNAHDGSFRGI